LLTATPVGDCFGIGVRTIVVVDVGSDSVGGMMRGSGVTVGTRVGEAVCDPREPQLVNKLPVTKSAIITNFRFWTFIFP
jgi:hypothetical protein